MVVDLDVFFRGHPRISPLAAETAEVLDEAKIPYVLWGYLAVAFAGENLPTKEIELVIPDEHLQAATETLAQAGYHVHFHTDGMDDFFGLLSLFKKSTTLWWLPEFPQGLAPADDPHFMLSTDRRLPSRIYRGPSGPWTELYPIKIMNPDILTEAVILLLLRDLDKPNGLDLGWRFLLTRLMDTLDRSHAGAEVPKTLRPRFRPFWESYNRRVQNGNRNIWEPLRVLHREMVANGE
ncbi:hypothetical protein ASPWEDRAFT_32634 [Aspergillus wentii DTO 134E9]|uniref:Uncharacterized protein n=1 Tax=Aspergillus wentii DTO 134E9 TaxID=1073089 RepID=A0A1L9R6E4_ASPWE|nr:uncharacterized protein ASPWEDRAFT_32634 [Aspergillus wentii DTO 134E9]OJJ30458.1 hypothetical protein ASPWEDRAFT_32634 [Aspergillus wentii DTO 134E9]